jgi:hypothetical protein
MMEPVSEYKLRKDFGMTNTMRFSVRLMAAAVLVCAVGGCFPLPPITITIPLPVNIDLGNFQGPFAYTVEAGKGHTFGDFELPVGTALSDLTSIPIALEIFPSEAKIDELVQDEAEDFAEVDLDLTSMQMVSMVLNKTQGDFGFVTKMEIYFIPKPVDGVAQPAILFGVAENPNGFGDAITLIPPTGVDLLEMIRANDANPAPGFPTYYTRVSGSVPAVSPIWNTSVTISVDGNVAFTTTVLEMCEFPSEAKLYEFIEQEAGELVAKLVKLDKAEVVSAAFNATQNDFSALSAIHLFFVPKPLGGIEQPAITMGEAEAPGGFGTEIVLAPPEPLDFMQLIRDNDANPDPSCPGAYLTVAGSLPEALPVWDTKVTLKIYAHIGF